MIVAYGNYQLDDNSAGWVISSRAKLDSSGTPYAYSEEYKLNIRVEVEDTGNAQADQAALTAKLQAIQDAFAVPFKDLIVYDNFGQQTVHKLINSQTLGGVKPLTRLEYPVGMGAEYSTFRNCTITIGADVQQSGLTGNNSVIDWTESLTYIGTGGPRRVWQEFIEELPENQIVAQRTTIKAIQEGAAVGFGDYIPFPAAIFPIEVEHEDQRVYRRMTPRMVGGGANREYPSMWTYVFEFSNPIFGNPTGRPT